MKDHEILKEDSIFSRHKPEDLALYLIGLHGQTDGYHHKIWVLDQVARILSGAEIRFFQKTFGDGSAEHWFEVGGNGFYNQWRADWFDDYYDEGIPP